MTPDLLIANGNGTYLVSELKDVTHRPAATLVGLSCVEVDRRLQIFGLSALEDDGGDGDFKLLACRDTGPLVIILIVAAAKSLSVKEWAVAAVIVTIVVASKMLDFSEGYQASNTVVKLRDGRAGSVDDRSLGLRDVVLMSSGSLIPTYIRMLRRDNGTSVTMLFRRCCSSNGLVSETSARECTCS